MIRTRRECCRRRIFLGRRQSFWGEGNLSGEKAIFLGRRQSFWGEGNLSGEKAIFLGRRQSFWGEGDLSGEPVERSRAIKCEAFVASFPRRDGHHYPPILFK